MKSLTKKIVTETGVSSQNVETALNGYANKISQLPKEVATVKVTALVKNIAERYGARAKLEESVLSECVNLILEKFKILGLVEIVEAYRMWAAGEIQAKGGEMYGGAIHATQIGRVLAAYTENRAVIVGKYLSLKHEAEKKRMQEEKAAAMKAKYEEEFPSYLANWAGQSWKDVPYHWYSTCMEREMIQFAPGEAQKIFEKAKQLAKLEIQTEKEEEQNIYKKATLQNNENCSIEDRAKVIARKMAVYQKVLI